MLKTLRAGLRGLFGPDPEPSHAATHPPARVEPSAWFVKTRARIAAHDAAVADELRSLVQGEPDNVEALVLQGESMLAARAHAAAVPVLRRAVELGPQFAEAHDALGRALNGIGRSAEATACFERAIGIAHDLVSAHVNLGRLHEALGNSEEAADCFNLALAFDGNAIEAGLGSGRLMRSAGCVDESLARFRQIIDRAPNHAPAFFELARSLNQAGDTAGAVDAYERAIVLAPGYSEARVNLGLIHLSQLGDARRAEDLFRQAAQADPDLVEAHANLGLALQEQDRIDEALRHYEELIRRWPDIIEFRWNRGIANLAAGNLERGWDDFELRKQRPDAGGVHQKFPFPDWDGSPLHTRSILVYGEQGLGDEIMYGSCLPEVIAQAETCIVECDARLAALYRRSFPGARIEARRTQRERDWRATYPALAVQSAVASLPRYLRRTVAEFPARHGHLVADAGTIARWRAQLERFGPVPKIGISWRGGTRKTRGGLRSLKLDALDPLLDFPGAVFVALQRDVSDGERAALARRSRIFIPELPSDIDELAALLCALDLIISVDNTNVHLAGALGRPVWALLPPGAEWRYGIGGERMHWYPSVRLARRGREESWRSVLLRLAERLDSWCAQFAPETGRS